MMGAAPLLLVVPASRSSRLDDAKDTSYVFGNTPAAERFHTFYRNGSSCLHFTAAKVIAYIFLQLQL